MFEKLRPICIALVLMTACGSGDDDDDDSTPDAAVGAADAAPAPGPEFDDVSDSLDFDHAAYEFGGNGMAGLGWLDFDGDGDLDLLITNGPEHNNGLFRNDGGGVFTDVTTAAGIANGLGSAGIAVADIDNDGHVDIFLTGDGGVGQPAQPANPQTPTRMYHNNGDGTFTDISATAGVAGPETAMSATFGDIDGDGYVDLFIAAPGSLATKVQHANTLYRNNGDLTFTDISADSGVDLADGACVATFSHYDDDGLIDLFVGSCNDVNFAPTPFSVFRNNGDLTFTDVTAAAGLGPHLGYWMALAIGDYDNDGDLDVFSTNSGIGFGAARGHVLFSNNGDGTYTDVAPAAGVADWEFAWGAVLVDFDNDTNLDLYFTGALIPFPFYVIGDNVAAPGRLFENLGDGTFAEPTIPVNLAWDATSGVAHGDFDGDGFPDLAVLVTEIPEDFTTAGPRPGNPVLLQAQPNQNGWLTIVLEGTTSNRSAIGARIEATAGGVTQIREVQSGSSFASQNTPWPTFGLGEADSARIVVHWPSGDTEDFGTLDARQKVTLVEGDGSAL